MQTRLTILLFYLAGFVLILHNITPHVHDDVLTSEEPSQPQSILDWLSFAFQIDPGAGHLECFSKPEPLDMNAEELVLDQVQAPVIPAFKPTCPFSSSSPDTPVGIPPDKDLSPHALSLRGPPAA